MSYERLKVKSIFLFNSGDYIGQKLWENGFDPKGKGTSTMLDDLVSEFALFPCGTFKIITRLFYVMFIMVHNIAYSSRERKKTHGCDIHRLRMNT